MWNYFVPSFPIYFMPLTNVCDASSIPSSNNPQSQEGVEAQTFFLDLNQADLRKAGYQNKKKQWTEEEDQVLRRCYEIQHKQWEDIAKLLPGRNDKMCYSRYQRLKNQTKNIWRKVDNEKLCILVDQLESNWKQICKHFQKRNPKQIKEHYLNYVKPGIKKDDWTLEEDLKLVNYLNLHGVNWKSIQDQFPGRTQNQIKNRYFGRLKKLAQKKESLKESEKSKSQSSI